MARSAVLRNSVTAINHLCRHDCAALATVRHVKSKRRMADPLESNVNQTKITRAPFSFQNENDNAYIAKRGISRMHPDNYISSCVQEASRYASGK